MRYQKRYRATKLEKIRGDTKMEIKFGLQNGMVMQRGQDDTCAITIGLQAAGAVKVSRGQIEEKAAAEEGIRTFRLTGIPTGGPYSLTVSDDESQCTIDNFYVGDVWILAGQSNMDGVGVYADIKDEYESDLAAGIEDIRAQYMDDNWKVASPMLHQTWMSKDPFFVKIWSQDGMVKPTSQLRGVGPGYYFAKDMRRRCGVPQGVLACALGGSGMGQWDPSVKTLDGSNLYSSMMRRYRLAGGNARGMFWYQGCSETGTEAAAIFTDVMVRFCHEFRQDMGVPDMPFVQVQILRYVVPVGDEFDRNWSSIREQQRTLGQKVANMDTLSVCTASMADGIHLSSRSQIDLGIRAAESMYHLCFDREGKETMAAPDLESVGPCTVKNNLVGNVVAVKFKNLKNGLKSEGLPTGFAFTTDPAHITDRNIYRIELEGDTALLYHEIPADRLKNMYLYYNFGCGTYCNLTDGAGRPIPAFGPIPVCAENT